MIAKDIHYIGVNDHRIDLFESQYIKLNVVSYNSCVIRLSFVAKTGDISAEANRSKMRFAFFFSAEG